MIQIILNSHSILKFYENQKQKKSPEIAQLCQRHCR